MKIIWLWLAFRLVPTRAGTRRHDLHKGFNCMDLSAVNFERFPDDQRISRSVRARIAEIHPQENDSELFIDGGNPGRNGGMLHDGLSSDVFASGAGTPGAGSDPAILETVSRGTKRCFDRSETADFETCRIELSNFDRLLTRRQFGLQRHFGHDLIG